MARACGKVILLGEHAVVYGVPAIGVGIDRGATAVARAGSAPRIQIGDRAATSGDGSDLGTAYAALLNCLDARDIATDVELKLPAGAGLGASAALAVAVARAVLDVTEPHSAADENARMPRVLEAANAWEGVFHGRPSGVDAAAAAYGGCIWFSRSAANQPAQIEQINVLRELPLAIAIAGPPASTKMMVEGVARERERRPQVFERSLDGIASLVRNAKLCIEAGDLPGLGKLMDLNQMLLSGLFLSTDGIECACQLAREAGALGAKLTGAGGGGCVVALADLDPEPILAAWRSEGFDCFAARARATGAT